MTMTTGGTTMATGGMTMRHDDGNRRTTTARGSRQQAA
jgi:hypothetical protein